MTAMTVDQIEQAVVRDYAALTEHYIRVTYLIGYAENGDSIECNFEEPGILIRVDSGANANQDLRLWIDDWCDPRWPVTPLEERSELDGGHGWEIYGTSYRADTDETEPLRYSVAGVLETATARLRHAFRNQPTIW